MEKGDFSHFAEIHSQMAVAVSRWQALENKLADHPLPTDVAAAEFADLPWAKQRRSWELDF